MIRWAEIQTLPGAKYVRGQFDHGPQYSVVLWLRDNESLQVQAMLPPGVGVEALTGGIARLRSTRHQPRSA